MTSFLANLHNLEKLLYPHLLTLYKRNRVYAIALVSSILYTIWSLLAVLGLTVMATCTGVLPSENNL